MASPETLKFSYPEITAPSVTVIRELKSQGFIKDGSPFWWSTDFKPDPREFVPFDQFQERLIHLGENEVLQGRFSFDKSTSRRDVYLYPNPQVPISIVNLPIDGQSLPFMVTVRPYHEKELTYTIPYPKSLEDHKTIEELAKGIKKGEKIDLPEHFYPHIRGLFAGRRGNHFFWYPVRPFPLDELSKGNYYDDFKQLKKGLREEGISSLDIYNYHSSYGRTQSYPGVWNEIMKRPDLMDVKGGTKWPNYSTTEVSAEEFLEDFKALPNLLVYYPLIMPDFEHTLPLLITNTTNQGATNRRPVILGVYADNGHVGRSKRRGIFRIRNRDFAQTLAKAITSDFGTPTDAVLFTPQKGKPKYERVSSQ